MTLSIDISTELKEEDGGKVNIGFEGPAGDPPSGNWIIDSNGDYVINDNGDFLYG